MARILERLSSEPHLAGFTGSSCFVMFIPEGFDIQAPVGATA